MRKVGSGSSQQINKALELGAHRLENNDWLPRSQIQHCWGWTSAAADRCWEGVNPGLGEDRGWGSSSTAACQGVEREALPAELRVQRARLILSLRAQE